MIPQSKNKLISYLIIHWSMLWWNHNRCVCKTADCWLAYYIIGLYQRHCHLIFNVGHRLFYYNIITIATKYNVLLYESIDSFVGKFMKVEVFKSNHAVWWKHFTFTTSSSLFSSYISTRGVYTLYEQFQFKMGRLWEQINTENNTFTLFVVWRMK